MNSAALLSLLQLSDPTLPIGGFSHSAALETYVQARLVYNKQTASDFITAQLAHNLFYTDAALVSLSHDAATSENVCELQALDQECNAVKLPREMRQASQKLGWRLLKLFEALQPNELAAQLKDAVDKGEAFAHYPVVFGLVAKTLGIGKVEALTAFFYNAAVGMVTNSVKLVPLGQQDGQAILFFLHPLLHDLAARALSPNRDLIGLCCTGFDLRSMQHEALYSRLYMS